MGQATEEKLNKEIEEEEEVYEEVEELEEEVVEEVEEDIGEEIPEEDQQEQEYPETEDVIIQFNGKTFKYEQGEMAESEQDDNLVYEVLEEEVEVEEFEEVSPKEEVDELVEVYQEMEEEINPVEMIDVRSILVVGQEVGHFLYISLLMLFISEERTGS